VDSKGGRLNKCREVAPEKKTFPKGKRNKPVKWKKAARGTTLYKQQSGKYWGGKGSRRTKNAQGVRNLFQDVEEGKGGRGKK